MAEIPPKFNGGVVGSTKLTAKLLEALAPPLSLTVTTIVAGPAIRVVPVIAPAVEMLKPAGNPVAEKVRGEIPPDAAIDAEYGVPTVPLFNVLVVMTSGADTTLTAKVFVCGVLFGSESFTVTVTVKAPGALGVPEIAGPLAVTPSGKPVTVQA